MESQPSQEVTELLRQWEEEHSTQGYDPIPTLTRLSEIIETETENFMKKDPDPFDERHPSRSDPNCALGHALKVMFKKDNFMTKLVNDYVRETYYTRMYITRDVRELNIAACRLTLDLMPGLEMSVVFQDNEVLIQRLYTWAENSMEPLQSYATGLLAAAMEVSDIAVNYREQNGRLIPIMLQRLHTLKKKPIENQVPAKTPPQTRHFARFGKRLDSDHLYSPTPRKKGRYKEGGGEPDAVTEKRKSIDENSKLAQNSEPTNHESTPTKIYEIDSSPSRDLVMSPPPRPPPITLSAVHASNDIGSDNASVPIIIAESSNSSWAEMESHVIGSMQIHPLSDASKQMLILRYLTPLGEYQEFLSYVFEHGALDLILGYINMKESRDSRLAFEALKYLSSLLCHKKFSLEFINLNGLQKFLEVPRPSVAATGVSICLYYLAYCEDAMERVCQLPSTILADLVRFALWLLECSHDSGRCHATMFFGLSFQFPVILEEFDHQDGLRKLYNVISTLPILSEDTVSELTDDESCAARQIVRHVSVALKRYLEAHLRFKVVQLHRQGNLYTEQSLEAAILSNPPYKAIKRTPEQIQEHIEDLQKSEFSRWPPVDQLVRLGGVSMLLQIIAFTYDWNFNGRAETVRCALDVISVCSVLPKVQMLLCDKVEMPDEEVTTGVNIILSAAEGEIVADAEVQKAALNVLVNCVCTPYRGRGYTLINPLKKKFAYKYDDVIQKIWESVRRNNGIMMLLQLMLVKSPITDADSIRGLACQALAGLARCTTVTQIISKLPLFTTGQIQSLMHDPILQEKRHEHVMFQKYALELMERVSGKSKHMAHIETSLANIHRANVVAQTRIRYNEEQLLVLIYRHLQSRGYKQAATTLKETAQLNSPDEPEPIIHHPHHQLYDEYCRPRTLGRSLMSAMNACTPNSTHSHSATNQMTLRDSGIANSTTTATTPNVIKLRRIQQQSSLPMVSPLSASAGALTPRSLQKPWRGAAGAPPPPAALAAARRPAHRITLDSIVTEYLTNQHSLCRNPIATCPQFNLFEPHKCSEGREDSRSGVSSRIFSREYDAFKLARGQHIPKLVHSRFSNVRTLRPADLDSYFTTCVFHPHQQTVLAATSTGEIKVFSNTTNTQDDTTYTILENTYIYHMEISRDGKMLLISTNNVWRPFSAVVDTDRFLVPFNFEGEEYAEFGKKNQDKVICTKGEVASIYDITTQRKLVNLKPNISNQYTKNRATFSPDDHLVLSDGVLWDVKAGKEIHKLDKLNQSLSGVFHPNGLEVISNAEVWDLRTFHLLKTVPSLDKAEVIFPHNCTCLYSVGMEQETDDKTQYDTSFRTLDPYHYTNIATIDVKKDIYSLAVNRFDTQIALVENCGIFDSIQESVIKIYDVGRRRDLEDEADEEEDDDITGTEENEEDDGSDSASENGDLQMQLLRDVVELGFNNDLINLDEDADHDGDHEDNEDNDANPNDGGGSDGHEQSDDTDPASESDSDAGDAALASVRYNRRAAPRGARSLPRRAAARRALRRRGRQPAQPPSSAGDDFALAEELANDLAALDGDRTSDNDSLQERDAS